MFSSDDVDEINTQNCIISDWNGIFGHLNNSLSILSINVRSLRTKFPELTAQLSAFNNRFTFIVLTEIWLNASSDIDFDIDGYKCILLCRETQRGGGIKLYYLENK